MLNWASLRNYFSRQADNQRPAINQRSIWLTKQKGTIPPWLIQLTSQNHADHFFIYYWYNCHIKSLHVYKCMSGRDIHAWRQSWGGGKKSVHNVKSGYTHLWVIFKSTHLQWNLYIIHTYIYIYITCKHISQKQEKSFS